VLTAEQVRNLVERAQEFQRVQAQELELEMSRAARLTLAPADRRRSESFSDSDSESEPDGQWRQISPTAARPPRYLSPERPVLHPPGLSRSLIQSSRGAAAVGAFVCLFYIFLNIFSTRL
jgi:hypothetical protein